MKRFIVVFRCIVYFYFVALSKELKIKMKQLKRVTEVIEKTNTSSIQLLPSLPPTTTSTAAAAAGISRPSTGEEERSFM